MQDTHLAKGKQPKNTLNIKRYGTFDHINIYNRNGRWWLIECCQLCRTKSKTNLDVNPNRLSVIIKSEWRQWIFHRGMSVFDLGQVQLNSGPSFLFVWTIDQTLFCTAKKKQKLSMILFVYFDAKKSNEFLRHNKNATSGCDFLGLYMIQQQRPASPSMCGKLPVRLS